MKIIIPFLLLIIMTGCVGNSLSSSLHLADDDLFVINIENVIQDNEHRFLLSDIAQSIEYIPLEFTPECPLKISVWWAQYYTSQDIFVLSDVIYRFDQNGKFLNRIGSKGRGPGEFGIALMFTVDTVSRRVYIASNEYQTHVYDYNGEHIRSIREEGKAELGFFFLGQTNELVYTGADIHGAKYPDNFFIKSIDTLGNIRFMKKTLVHGMLNEEQRTWWKIPTIQYGNGILAYDFMNDTIFFYRQSTLTPYLILNYGQYKITIDALLSRNFGLEAAKYFRTRFYGSTPRYLFLNIHQQGDIQNPKRYDIRFDKSTGECISQKQEVDQGVFMNDLDGGMSIGGLSRFNKNNQWVFPLEAFDMIEKLTPEYLSTAKVKDPQAHQRLKQLVENLKAEDNPVLMRIILKQETP